MYPTTLKNDEKYSEMSANFQEKLEVTRTDWYTKIGDLIAMSRDFEKLADVQVLQLSYRHQLIEYCYGSLSKAIIQVKSIYEKNKKTCLLESKVNFDFKLNTEKERFVVIDADMRTVEEMIEIFEAQMNFVKESIKLLDNLGFSIKSRIEMYKIMGGDN